MSPHTENSDLGGSQVGSGLNPLFSRDLKTDGAEMFRPFYFKPMGSNHVALLAYVRSLQDVTYLNARCSLRKLFCLFLHLHLCQWGGDHGGVVACAHTPSPLMRLMELGRGVIPGMHWRHICARPREAVRNPWRGKSPFDAAAGRRRLVSRVGGFVVGSTRWFCS